MPINNFPILEGKGESGLRLNYTVKPTQIELIELDMRQQLRVFKEQVAELVVALQTTQLGLNALEDKHNQMTMAWDLSKHELHKHIEKLYEQAEADRIEMRRIAESLERLLAWHRLPWYKRWFTPIK